MPVDRLLSVDQLDDTSVLLTFEHNLGTTNSYIKVDLTVKSGFEKEVITDIVSAIDHGQGMITIADKANGIYVNDNISDVSVDDSAQTTTVDAGAGITGGRHRLPHFVEKNGNIIKTSIYIDLTGLRSTAGNDIIGVDGTSDKCHIGKIVAAMELLLVPLHVLRLQVAAKMTSTCIPLRKTRGGRRCYHGSN